MPTKRLAALIAVVLTAAVLRIVPHPWNVSPVAAMALFAGAYFENRAMAFGVPLAALLLSDWALGFYSSMWIPYGSFALIVGIGMALGKRPGVAKLAFASLAGSLSFFILTNFGVWATTPLYAKTLSGLSACYIAAIPFFQNTVLGDLFYAFALFGVFAVAERRIPALRTPVLE